MLSLILKVIGVIDTTMMLIVTLSICAIFLIAYVLIFYDYLKKLSQDCPNVKKIPRLQNRGIYCILNAEKLSK